MIGAMGRFEGRAGVQHQGCYALANLAYNNAGNKVAIAAEGGIAAVIGGMGRCEGDARLQEYGCMLLAMLARNGKEGRK